MKKLLDLIGRKKSLVKEVPEEILKQTFQEIPKLEERLSEGEMALLEKKQRLEEMCKDRRYAKMEEWRKKFAAEGAVTRTARSGSPTSDMEAELLSTEIEDRKEEMGLSKNQYMEDAQSTEVEGGFGCMCNRSRTTACTSQSTAAEKKNGDTRGLSGNAGLRFGTART